MADLKDELNLIKDGELLNAETLNKPVISLADLVQSKLEEQSDVSEKLDGIEEGAQVNVQSDWTETNQSSDAFIRNKPISATQTEAETGSSSNLRLWSPLRITQLVNSWWNRSENKTKLDGIATGATKNDTDAKLRDRATHTGEQPISSVSGLQAALDGKVDKQVGYGLSQENFTPAEKSKLASIEGSKFKGEYVSLDALKAAHQSPEVGSYAYVDAGVGEVVTKYIWDSSDAEWVEQRGETASLTPAEIKSLYEGNSDTNAFTDSEKTKLAGVQSGATKNATDAQLRDRSTHTGEQPISSVSGLQAALDNKVNNDDPRLTNSGSGGWDAEIVSQEEAEEGTSTTPRKWTAQRVRQAYNAAWAESKEEFLSNTNFFTAGQVIRIEQGAENLILANDSSSYALIGFTVGLEDPETTKGFYLGSDKDGNLVTLYEGGSGLQSRVWTSGSLPVRSKWDVENYTGRGVTLAEDAREVLELGPPTNSIYGYLMAGRNENITIDRNSYVLPQYNYFGTGEFASITIRSDSATPRTVRLNTDILNRRDFDEEYIVTDTEALYLEGRYVDSGFMIMFLTLYPIPT